MRDIFLSLWMRTSLWGFCCLQHHFYGHKDRQVWQGLGGVFTLLSLSSDGQSPLDVVTWFLPRSWVMAGRAKIGKELKFVPSAQMWATDLPNSSVPGSDCCGDKGSCLFPKGVHPFSVSAGSWPSYEQVRTQQFQSEMAHVHSVACSWGFTLNVVVMLGLNFMILKVLSHFNNLGFHTLKNPKQTTYCSSPLFLKCSLLCWVTLPLPFVCSLFYGSSSGQSSVVSSPEINPARVFEWRGGRN